MCNHPDLFEPRPIISPFRMLAIQYYTASLVLHAKEYNPFQVGGDSRIYMYVVLLCFVVCMALLPSFFHLSLACIFMEFTC